MCRFFIVNLFTSILRDSVESAGGLIGDVKLTALLFLCIVGLSYMLYPWQITSKTTWTLTTVCSRLKMALIVWSYTRSQWEGSCFVHLYIALVCHQSTMPVYMLVIVIRKLIKICTR